jgi:hypothetical protein
MIDDVFVRSWSTNGELLLRVDTRGDASRLRQIFALDGTLVPWVPAGGPTGAVPSRIAPVESQLVFVPRWLSEMPERAETP